MGPLLQPTLVAWSAPDAWLLPESSKYPPQAPEDLHRPEFLSPLSLINPPGPLLEGLLNGVRDKGQVKEVRTRHGQEAVPNFPSLGEQVESKNSG
jgi:hypothetical protein